MQIVIDISDYDKEWVTNGYCIPDEINGRIAEAIINGVSLPEHHGRLIDINDIEWARHTVNKYWYDEDTVVSWDVITDAPTMIEADKAESEGLHYD